MPRILGTILAALALAPAATRAGTPQGQVTTDAGATELLSSPVRVGVRVDLPEGWYRVEGAGPEDRRVGSFSVVSADAFAAESAAGAGASDAAAAGPSPAEAAAPRPAAAAAPDRCRAERDGYLRELLRMRGIDVEDPEGVLAGLSGQGFAPGLATAWLALDVDPLQPLAWSQSLRDRAAALARCTRGR